MMARTHIPIGLAAGIIVGRALNIEAEVYYLAAAGIGSILPDADHPKGKLNQKILIVNNKIGKIITYIFLAYMSLEMYVKNPDMNFLIYFIPLFIMIALSKHRGITHSLLGSLIIIFLAFRLGIVLKNSNVIIGFASGYLSHLIADFFTDEGIELLYPCRKNYRFPVTITTNGFTENIISMASIAFCIYIFLGKL